jgi:L-threonylcarbamoyladenylate synthase
MRTLMSNDPSWITEVCSHLRGGGVVALPTETVYGLAASLKDPRGTEQIFALKARPSEKALPWQVDSIRRAQAFGFSLSPGALRLGALFWPGPLTLLLARPSACPAWFAPASEVIALRVPDHSVPLSLLAALGEPLAVTSANPSGHRECLSAQEVLRAFPGSKNLLVVDGGAAAGGRASTVVDASGQEPILARDGPIPFDRVLEVWHGRT